jgi:hypothetical protein
MLGNGVVHGSSTDFAHYIGILARLEFHCLGSLVCIIFDGNSVFFSPILWIYCPCICIERYLAGFGWL